MGISDPGICMHRVTESLAYYDGKEHWRIKRTRYLMLMLETRFVDY